MKVVGLLAAWVVIALCVGVVWLSWWSHRLYARALETCVAQEVELDPSRLLGARADLAQHANAADDYLRLAAMLAPLFQHDMIVGPLVEQLTDRPAGDWTQGDRLRVEAVAERHREALRLLVRAGARPDCRFELTGMTDFMNLPDWGPVLPAARLASLEGRLMLEQRDGEGALARAESILALAVAMQRVPLPQAADTAYEAFSACVPLLRELTRRMSLRHGEQQRLERRLASLRIQVALARGVETQVALAHAAMEPLAVDPRRRMRELGPGSLLTFWMDRANYVLEAHHLSQAIREPWPGGRDAIYDAATREPPWYLPLSRMGLPDLRARQRSALLADSEITVVRCALALDAHKTVHGGLPTNLDALVDDLLWFAPVDPMAPPAAVRYRVTGGTALVYSVGENRQDDGGAGDDIAWLVR